MDTVNNVKGWVGGGRESIYNTFNNKEVLKNEFLVVKSNYKPKSLSLYPLFAVEIKVTIIQTIIRWNSFPILTSKSALLGWIICNSPLSKRVQKGRGHFHLVPLDMQTPTPILYINTIMANIFTKILAILLYASATTGHNSNGMPYSSPQINILLFKVSLSSWDAIGTCHHLAYCHTGFLIHHFT